MATTRYEIGSITKQFTAAAILQLAEAGKIDLDAKVAAYLPLAPHAGEITVRQLLSHTSGLPDYFDGPTIEVEATKPTTFDQLISRVKNKPLDFPPGTQWSYSNTGYILLGRLIEVASQDDYKHYVRTHFLGPAGMTNTFTVSEEFKLPNMAIGYWHKDGRLQRAAVIHDSFGWSAGNLISTVDDLEKWNRALRDGKIVSRKTYSLMTTPAVIEKGAANYGLGLFVESFDNQPRIGHTGGSFGFTTANEYFPKQDVQIIAFTNSGDGSPEPGERITNAIFEDLFPEIARNAHRGIPGESPAVTALVKDFFAQLQSGTEKSSDLTAQMDAKMKDGLAKRMLKQFGPFGAPAKFVFQAQRTDPGAHWYYYLIDFGPGASLYFGVSLDDNHKINHFSFGK